MEGKYALILIELFNIEMLNGVHYPVNIEMNGFQMLEYNSQPDPTGNGWIIFEGENSNVECSEYINEINANET